VGGRERKGEGRKGGGRRGAYQLSGHGRPESKKVVSRESKQKYSECQQHFTTNGGVTQHLKVFRQLLCKRNILCPQ
jgi:hypothetical protein